jgi:uncharacterized protein YidB (DUF937 family)
MGLLDNILGSVMNSGTADQSANPLVQIAMKMLTEQGAGGQSGLTDIVAKFQQGGLGHLADSWVGTGENLPVSAEQISQVLGSGKLEELANQFGFSTSDVAGGLSKVLPDLINQVTPEGKLPESADFINNALAMFLKR